MAGKEEKEGRVFAEYFIGDAVVRLRQHDNGLLYEVEEPELNDRVKKLLDRAMEEYVRRGTEPEKLAEKYSKKLRESEAVALRYYLLRELRGYSKLHVFMLDENIEDFTITQPGPVRLIHRLAPHYEWIESNVVIETDEELESSLGSLSRGLGGR